MVLKKFVPALILSIVMAGAAAAQSPSRISQFNAWGAYSYNAPNGKVCYILSLPTRKEPSNVNHGDIFFLISQRPGQNVSYEPQAMMGYPLKEESKVTVNVDGKNYTLFTKGDSAWVENAAEEPALVSAMRAGSSMTVRATSRRGTNTTYTFSLSGVTAALNEIQNCK
ncbi:invasion associated locus B family protein [Hoeflea prorocentri]|uniref:Invasion associated locus B family protein n=1 Tax=Hoeflea prorocentri TaxID=1922333 RepID=A0A9X3ZJC9_9HYPH|nr:invasion associated locus B family protein [Hoeflea prorocentri]MCY6383324.1 invasion associated locus B family protein [Hoeflea prorocentri]MDA5401124.1 invasion associated locus B family protein [Hoeflea prorocentri]